MLALGGKTLRLLAVWLVCITLAACAQREDQLAFDSTAPDSVSRDSAAPAFAVTAHGAGAVRIGMTLEELSAAVGESVRPAFDIDPECDFVRPARLPKGVSLMILSDSVARIDVEEAGVLTSEGAGVGDSESRVVALYGSRATVAPHKYTGPEGHYVIVSTPGDTLHRIIFETDGARVERYRAGRGPGVDYVEGCA